MIYNIVIKTLKYIYRVWNISNSSPLISNPGSFPGESYTRKAGLNNEVGPRSLSSVRMGCHMHIHRTPPPPPQKKKKKKKKKIKTADGGHVELQLPIQTIYRNIW